MLNKKGQNTAEYAILISVIVAAAVGMQIYVKRGLQARVQEVVSHTGAMQTVGDTKFSFTGGQYEPYYAESTTEVKSDRTHNEAISARGQITRDTIKEFSGVKEAGKEKTSDTTDSD